MLESGYDIDAKEKKKRHGEMSHSKEFHDYDAAAVVSTTVTSLDKPVDEGIEDAQLSKLYCVSLAVLRISVQAALQQYLSPYKL